LWLGLAWLGNQKKVGGSAWIGFVLGLVGGLVFLNKIKGKKWLYF
jgi:hypothetical protein